MDANETRDTEPLHEAARLQQERVLRTAVLSGVEHRALLAAYQRALLRAEQAGFSAAEIAEATDGPPDWVAKDLTNAHFRRTYAHVDEQNRTLEELLDDYAVGQVSREELRQKLLHWPYREAGEPVAEIDPEFGPKHREDSFSNIRVAYRVEIIDENLYQELNAYHNKLATHEK